MKLTSVQNSQANVLKLVVNINVNLLPVFRHVSDPALGLASALQHSTIGLVEMEQ